MSSKPLNKLEKLAGNRVEQTRTVLMREISQLEKITRHVTDLKSINREYQQSIVGESDVEPQQLEQRRKFVEKLTVKLDELNDDRKQMIKRIDENSIELNFRSAQHSAIGIINEQRKESLLKTQTRREQQQLDEIGGVQHLSRSRCRKEDGNE